MAARGAFLLGSTAADVRAITGQHRSETHFYRLGVLDAPTADEALLADYPSLADPRALPGPQAAFVSGYLVHLAYDERWAEDLFLPLYWNGPDWPDRLTFAVHHNALRVVLDRRAFDRILGTPEAVEALRGTEPAAEPEGWLPFVADAVLRETQALADEIGPEHVLGGVEVDLDDFVVTYIDDGFQLGLPHVGPHGNIPLADPVAHALDLAALALLDRGGNESEPDGERPVRLLGPGDADPERVRAAAGPFSKLSREDRLRAIGLLDEFELKLSPAGGDLFEFDAGLVGQLVVGFTEMIYYSEWQGYDDFTRAPSERVHPNEPSAVQSWRQTGFPGFANGYAALRGYLGSDDGPLGGGETWATIDDGAAGVRIAREPGTFAENDYDTSGYEEPYPE